jgi:hypothetical protein
VRYRGRVWMMGAERIGRAAVTVIENTSLSRFMDRYRVPLFGLHGFSPVSTANVWRADPVLL